MIVVQVFQLRQLGFFHLHKFDWLTETIALTEERLDCFPEFSLLIFPYNNF